jgi:DNA-binding MarR family transcriptional regulator
MMKKIDGAAPTQEPQWLGPEELAAWRSLQMMQMRLNAAFSRHLMAISTLSLQDYVILVVLTEQEDGQLRPYLLARTVGWERSRLSHHLSRMQKRGLVEKVRCVEDGRGALIAITKKGRNAIEQAAPSHVADVRSLFIDLLGPEEIAAIGQVGEKVLAHLDQVESEMPEECGEKPGDFFTN